MDIRPSPIAGTWYPGDAKSLAISIDQLLHEAEPREIQGQVVGLVVPHAGHRYSGAVAAQAFRLIQGDPRELVVVISPLHMYTNELILTSDHEAYGTPLGTVPIERDRVAEFETQLAETYGIKVGRLRNDREHSLEIELPFVQRCLGSAISLLPIMIRDQSVEVAQAIGETLAALLQGQDCLIIASSDLSHFYPQTIAEQLDQRVLGYLERFDPAGLIEVEETGKGFACGRGAMAAALWAAQGLGADQVALLQHATSGDVTGDYDSVVGYGSAVIYHQN